MLRKVCWMLVVIFCVVLVSTPASTQEMQWEKHMATAAKAFQQGRYADAKKSLQAALKEGERLGPQDPHVALSLNNLALLYHVQGKYAEAMPLYERALVISKKALGPEHKQVAILLENCAYLLREMNREVEAAEMEARAKAIRAKHTKETQRSEMEYPKQSL